MDFACEHPPDSMAILLTSKCNADCAYCPYRKGILAFEADPPFNRIVELVRQAGAYGVRQIRFSGGEPLLRSDLEDLIQATIEAGMSATIVTNGALLSQTRLFRLISAGLQALTWSLDTLEPDTYEAVRRLPFSHVERNLKLFEELRQTGSPLWVGVTVVISRFNIHHILQMTHELSQRGIPVQFQPCHSYSQDFENDHNQPDLASLEEVITGLLALKASGDLINNSRQYLEGIPYFIRTHRPPPGFICQVSETMAVYDGDLYLRPCCFPLPPISNSNELSFQKAWTSTEMNIWREKFKHGECPGCWLLSLDTWK